MENRGFMNKVRRVELHSEVETVVRLAGKDLNLALVMLNPSSHLGVGRNGKIVSISANPTF